MLEARKHLGYIKCPCIRAQIESVDSGKRSEPEIPTGVMVLSVIAQTVAVLSLVRNNAE